MSDFYSNMRLLQDDAIANASRCSMREYPGIRNQRTRDSAFTFPLSYLRISSTKSWWRSGMCQ